MNRSRFVLCGGLVAVALALSACGPPTFSGSIVPMFRRSCVSSSCHSTAGHAGGMVLESAVAYANIVRVPSEHLRANGAADVLNRIEPGDPARSFLLHKVRNTMYTEVAGCGFTPLLPQGNCGVRMPNVSGVVLSDGDIATIRAWIVAGALDN